MAVNFPQPLPLVAATAALTLGLASVSVQSAEAFSLFYDGCGLGCEISDFNSAVAGKRVVINEDFSQGNLALGQSYDFGPFTSTQEPFPSAPGNQQNVNNGQGGRFDGNVGLINNQNTKITWQLDEVVESIYLKTQGFNSNEGFEVYLGNVLKFTVNTSSLPSWKTGNNFGQIALLGNVSTGMALDRIVFQDFDPQSNANFNVQEFRAYVPTPALLPGLIGMGVAALRKRKQEGSEQEA